MLEWLYKRKTCPRPATHPLTYLTAKIICREAVSTLLCIRDGVVKTKDMTPLHKLSGIYCGPKQYGIAFWVPDSAMTLPLETFSTRYVLSAMSDLSACVPKDLPLLPWTEKQIPQGCDAAAERFSSVAVRCVVMWYPNPELAAPREWQTHRAYYDVHYDEWKEGDGAMVVRFDVQTERPAHA